jgi:N-acetylglucosaminyl-diphospho-decaprenol L-rhamnosyltransferase
VPVNEHLSPRIVVAIVNYGTPELTINCLRSLLPEIAAYPELKAVVADNRSPDGSGAKIEDAIAHNGWTHFAKVLHLPKNGGFAYGNNAIISDCLGTAEGPEFVWLLNSDTEVRPGATAALVKFLQSTPECGLAGSCLEDPDGTQQQSYFRFHSLASEFETTACFGPVSRLLRQAAVAPVPERRSGRYDWLSGASLMVRASVFRTIGLMDDDYFLYFEETDFCRRAARSGIACWFVPDSRVVHFVGASTGVTNRDRQSARRSSYWFQSRRRYFMKHHGRVYAIAADAAVAAGTMLRRGVGVVRRKPAETPNRFLRDLFHHSALFSADDGGGRTQ